MGGILNDHGMASAALGRHRDAIEAYRSAIEAQRSVLERIPGAGLFRHFLGNHYYNLSRSLRAEGRPSEAAAAARECLGIRSNDPGGMYDAACELSLCVPMAGRDDGTRRAERDRYAAWAIDALRRAVHAGYRDFDHMRVDTDLDPLRTRDDFRLLMMDLTFPAHPFAPANRPGGATGHGAPPRTGRSS
jgi:tetratricopeptide (TPR) repeat protein